MTQRIQDTDAYILMQFSAATQKYRPRKGEKMSDADKEKIKKPIQAASIRLRANGHSPNDVADLLIRAFALIPYPD